MANGNWLLLHDGSEFDLDNIDDSVRRMSIETIALSLARQPRFNGHTSFFYSVAQHCYLMSTLFRGKKPRLEALMHDVAEVVLGDIPAPVKAQIPAIGQLEKKIYAAFAQRFCLPPQLAPSIKHADLMMLAAERDQIMPANPREWKVLRNVSPAPVEIVPWTEEQAFDAFLSMFYKF